MLYVLNTDCPVKWTATQEKSISRDLDPVEAYSSESATDRVSRIYNQTLWLPESIMPLDRLTSSLLLAANPVAYTPLDSQVIGLYEMVKPHLLNPRLVTEKYHRRISTLMEEEETTEVGPYDELMWYAMKYEKGVPEDSDATEEQQNVAYDSWKKTWLSRMEQREVMIQILLHFLLLTLPDIPQHEPIQRAADLTAPSPSPHKRKRACSTDGDIISAAALEERLELLMDRLAMWQLMGSIDLDAGGDERVRQCHRLTALHKGRQKTTDDRDWMQVFCEDIVEPLFRYKLPAQCSLLRSKVFQTSPFEEDDDLLDLDMPPASPRADSERLKKTKSRAEVGSGKERDLSRARSLSITLEEERVRERSKSLSIGPATMQRRALAREVSMSTAFKVKEKQKQQGQTSKRSALANPKGSTDAGASNGRGKDRIGTTLVAATPVKIKAKAGRSFAPPIGKERDVLPAITDDSATMYGSHRALEGDDNDDEWIPKSSPDVLLLTDEDTCPSPVEGVALGGHGRSRGRSMYGSSRMLVEATPTKSRKRD